MWTERLLARLRRVPTALRRPAIPLADVAALRRPLVRTTAIRLGLLAALLLLAVIALWRAATLEARTLTFIPRDRSAVLVIDQSKSVYLVGYRAIGEIFRRFADTDAPVGLVMFSDIAYELLPPGSHGSELRPLLRYYTPSSSGNQLDADTHFPANPWDNSFSGGTKVSSGLEMARQILERDHVKHGTILLVSDLDTVDTTTVAGSVTGCAQQRPADRPESVRAAAEPAAARVLQALPAGVRVRDSVRRGHEPAHRG